MENKPKTLQEAKNIFEKLKTGPKSVLFSEEKLDKRLLKKLKKSSYGKDNLLLKLINLVENDIDQINKTNQIPTRTDYVEKREIDRSTLVSISPMRSGKQILQKLNQFCDEIKSKRKTIDTQLQVDNEFQQVKIKYLNDK